MKLTPTERHVVEMWRPSDDNPSCQCAGAHICAPHALIAIIDRLVGRLPDPAAPVLDDKPMMVHVAAALDNFFNSGREPGEARETGFVLMVFPFDGSRDTKCISNGATRDNVIAMCRDTIKQFEGGEA